MLILSFLIIDGAVEKGGSVLRCEWQCQDIYSSNTLQHEGNKFNLDKFVLSRDVLECTGFYNGKGYIKPARKIMSFPVPKYLNDVRWWFGLNNQVAPFFTSRLIMQPFMKMLMPSANDKDENLMRINRWLLGQWRMGSGPMSLTCRQVWPLTGVKTG